MYEALLTNDRKILNLSSYVYGKSNYNYYIITELLAVNIFYSNLGYTLMSESPKTSIFDIVANIGGKLTYVIFSHIKK